MMSINQVCYRNHDNKAHIKKLYAENSLVQLTGVGKKEKKAQITANQPRSQGSLLLVPTEQERRRLGKKTWERGKERGKEKEGEHHVLASSPNAKKSA